MAVRVSVNGSDVGRESQVIVILRAGAPGREEAERLIEELTGCLPSTWTDGTGTTAIVASAVPVPSGRRSRRLGPELAVIQGGR
jgi:hypothetical protein